MPDFQNTTHPPDHAQAPPYIVTSTYSGPERRSEFRIWRESIDKRLDDGAHAMKGMRRDLDSNTKATEGVKKDTAELIELLHSVKGAGLDRRTGPPAGLCRRRVREPAGTVDCRQGRPPPQVTPAAKETAMPEAWKRKVTERALERMRNKPAWLQRQEAIEMAERSRANRSRPVQHPDPEDGDAASTQREVLV